MRKIGELKGKPIIEGNPNEIKNNQIHAKTEGGGITLSERKNGSLETISGGNSGGGGNNIEYYTFNINNINNIPESCADKLMFILRLFPLYKYTHKPLGDSTEYMIAGSAQFMKRLEGGSGTTNVIAIAYTPIYVGGNEFIMTLKHVFMYYELDIIDFDKVFTPITEEEFYDLNKWSLEDYK